MTDAKDSRSLKQQRDEFERNLISEALAACDNNVRRAARKLGMSRTGLYKRMRAVGIPLPSSGESQADDGSSNEQG